MDYDCTQFWERINNLIKLNGTKQENVAKECGINYQTFRGWVVHKTFPNALQSFLIAQTLGTSVEYLVTGESTDPYKARYDNLVEAIRNLPLE